MAVRKDLETTEQIRSRILDRVATHPDLDGMDIRVFLYMAARLNFEEYIHIPQMEITIAMGKQKTHISRAVRHLAELGLIIASAKGTRYSEWRLNEKFGSKR